MGNDAAISFAGSQGNFELNVFKPVMIFNFLHSVTLLHDACRGFVDYLINGITLNRARIDDYVANSLMLVDSAHPQDRLRQGRPNCAYGVRGGNQLARSLPQAGVPDGGRV